MQPVRAVWTSGDGSVWREYLAGDTNYPGGKIVAGPAAFIALASDGEIWRSVDAVQWDKATSASAGLLAGAWGPAGFVVLAGSPYTGGTSLEVLRSPDGLTWTTSRPAALDGFCLTSLAAGPGGYVALGASCSSDHQLVVAASADGSRWTRGDSATFSGDLIGPSGVAALETGWIAFSKYRARFSDPLGVQVWNSADGLHWRRTTFLRPTSQYMDPRYETIEMDGVVRAGGAYVAVGQYAWNTNWWYGLTWTSPDGASWHSGPTKTGPFPAVASDGQRLIAVGTDPAEGYYTYGWANEAIPGP